MKKYSWIVALMLALTVIFIGCGADPLPPVIDDSETFTDVELGTDYNYFGGQPANQKGWATDGQNDITKKLGIKLEDFQAAKYLVLELKEGGIKGGVHIVWGATCATKAEEADLGLSNTGWMSQQIVSDGGDPDTAKGATLSTDKKTLKIELSKALNRYDAYTSDTLTEVKLVVLYYQGVDNLVDNAYLQISNKPIPFVPATKIEINAPLNPVALSDIKLTATITPADASVQLVTWQIVQAGTTYEVYEEIDFKRTYVMDDRFSPSVKTDVIESRARDTIFVLIKDAGKVVVKATLKDAGEDKDGKKIDIVSATFEINVGFNPFGPLVGARDATGTDANKWPIREELAAAIPAKWFVVVSYGSSKFGTSSHIGNTQWVIQSTNSGWKEEKTGDGTLFNYTADSYGFYYLVFDLSKFEKYDTAIDDAKAANPNNYAQFLLNYAAAGDLGTIKGYVVPGDNTISKPTTGNVLDFNSTGTLGWGAGDDIGYITNVLPTGLSWE